MEFIILALVILICYMYIGKKDAESALESTKVISRKVYDADEYYKNKIDEANSICEKLYNEIKQEEKLVKNFINAKIKDFPVVADVIADLATVKDEIIAYNLLAKKRPALKGSDAVKEVKLEKRELIKRNKALEWEMKYIRRLLPWIDEVEDNPMEPVNHTSDYYNPNYNIKDSNKNNIDDAGYWLTPQEYQSLSNIQKYQLALDRYNKRHKNNWEIGRDYERYIGYLFEQKGFKVEYTGIENGFNDLGRDLICQKGQLIYIVQCKCWSNVKGKEIHEKHINQLYGTSIKYQIEKRKNLNKKCEVYLGYPSISELIDDEDYLIVPMFCSTVPYTDIARDFAKELSISLVVQLMPFGSGYPMIKCNINSKGEKIYHLPFDQMYDKTMISKSNEFYAMTVAEAEANGFRRAKRWLGNKNDDGGNLDW